MTWDKVASFLTLTLVSFQGVLLLVVPEYRNRVYNTVAEANQNSIPLLESIAEHGRLFIAAAMIPTVFIPRSWLIPRFFSLVAFVIYICIVYNLYLYRDVANIGNLLVQLLILVKFLFVFVDDLTEIEMEERRAKRKAIQEERARVQQQAQSKAKAQEVKEGKVQSKKKNK